MVEEAVYFDNPDYGSPFQGPYRQEGEFSDWYTVSFEVVVK